MAAAVPIVTAGFSLVSGISKAKSLKTQAKELEYQSKLQNLAGRQTSAQHRQNLNTALNTIEAVRATRNVRDSFGSFARRRTNLENAAENENTAVLSSKLREGSLQRQADSRSSGARFAFAGGLFKAGSSLAGF